MQTLRLAGIESGDILIPFGGVYGDGKGATILGKTVWVCEKNSFQLSTLCSEIEKMKGDVKETFTKPIVMRPSHMLMHKDHLEREDDHGAPDNLRVHWMLPKQFFVPEDGENRAHWVKVFGGAAKYLVKVLSVFAVC